MKLKKVVSLCLSAGRVCLFDCTDTTGEITQWLGDGCAAYPLCGIPYLDEETFCAIFDVPEKKQEKLMIRKEPMPEAVSVVDCAAGDRNVDTAGIGITFGGTALVPLVSRGSTARRITFIQKKYLAPLEDVMDVLQFVQRVDANGQPYIVVLAGMLITAVIYPQKTVCESFVEALRDLLDLSYEEMMRGHTVQDAAPAEPETGGIDGQGDLFEGDEDGEA